MSSVCLILLIGIPAAGKTTFTRIFKKRFEEHFEFKIFNIDDLAVVGAYKATKENVFDEVRALLTVTLKQAIGHSEEGCNKLLVQPKPLLIVVDDNFALRSSRKKFANLAREYKAGFLQVYFEIGVSTAILRNERRETKIPLEVIENFASIMEKCSTEDANTVILNAEIEFTEQVLLDVRSNVEYALQNPIFTIKEEKRVEPLGLLQKINVTLRRIVSEKVRLNLGLDESNKNRSDANKSCFDVKKCNDRKNEVFNRIKKGDIVIPDDVNSDDELYKFLKELL